MLSLSVAFIKRLESILAPSSKRQLLLQLSSIKIERRCGKGTYDPKENWHTLQKAHDQKRF
jgi:hypothetical protein